MTPEQIKKLSAELDDIAVSVLALVPYEGESFHRRQTNLFKRLHAIARALEGCADG